MNDSPTPSSLDEAFERWVDAFRGPLVGLLASWGSDWRASEELAQDSFAEAWMGRERFRGNSYDLKAVGAWLRGIAFNLHTAALRKRERAPRLLVDDQQPAPAQEEVDDRRARLSAAFALLSGPQQTILRMHYLEETGTREVAALLGLTPKAVEGRLHQARKALRAKLELDAPKGAQEVRA